MVKKNLFICFIAIIITFASTIVSFAVVPNEVESAVIDALDSIKEILNNEKHRYGISDNTDVMSKTELGNGFKYYEISENIKKENSGIDLIDLIVPVGYIFTIKTDNKPVAIAVVENQQDTWKCIGLSNYSSFEQDIVDAKNEAAKSNIFDFNNNDEKVIYDRRLGVYGFMKKGLDGKEYVGFVKENASVDIKKNDINDKDDFTSKILEINELLDENDNNLQDKVKKDRVSNKTIYSVITVSTILFLVGAVVFRWSLS